MPEWIFSGINRRSRGTDNLSATINKLNLLTDEGERGGEDEEHAIAVHGKCDGKIGRQAAPHKELVHCCPVMGVQTQLKNVILSKKAFFFFIWVHKNNSGCV